MENSCLTVSLRKKNRRISTSTLALANVMMMAGASEAADTTPAATPSSTPKSTPPKTGKATPPVKPQAAKPVTKDNSTTLNEVVVTAKPEGSYQTLNSANGKLSEPLLDAPQSIVIIPQALMKDQHASSLREVLQNVPGITFGAGEGGTLAGDNITIRGFNARNDIFIDGFRDSGVYNRDPFNLEQVEVIKGPASTFNGHGSTGGSVNLISKKPNMTPSYEANVGFGTDQYYRDTVDINQPLTGLLPNSAFRLNAMFQYNQTAGRDNIYDGRYGANPAFSFGLGTDSLATLSYFYLQEHDLPSYGLPVVNPNAIASNPGLAANNFHVAPVPYSNFYGFANRDFEDTTTQIPNLYLKHDFDEDLKIENTSRYENTLRKSVLTAPRFDLTSGTSPQFMPPNYTTSLPNGNLPPNTMTRELRARHQTDVLYGNQTAVTAKLETWSFKHSIVGTVEYSQEKTNSRTFNGVNVTDPLYAPQPWDAYPFPTQNWGPETAATLNDTAFSFFDTVEITPQWIVTGSARYDHLYSSSRTNATAVAPAVNFSRVDNLASWRAGLTYKPLPFGAIYFGYGTSYNPQIEGASNSATPAALAANTVGLAPEKNETFEFGTKWDLFDEKLTLTSAFFRTNKTNARIVDPSAPPGQTVFALQGAQKVEGIEVGAQGNITKELKIFGGYTYMSSRIMSGPPTSFPGNSLPNTPIQSSSVWLTYDLPYEVTVGSGVTFVDKRYATVANTNVANSYTTQQLMASYKVNKNVQLQVNVYNLWDEKFIQAVGSNFIPGAGRSFVFSADVKF